MSGSVVYQEPRSELQPVPATPLDEAAWQGWLEKGNVRDRRASAVRLKTVKWVAITGLLGTAAFWSQIALYDIVVRFVVTGAGLIVMLQAVHGKQYYFAAVFGAVALLYNPVAPTFAFSGGWERAVVVASAIPFAASLAFCRTKDGPQ